MSKKYIIVCNDDNSFTIENGDINGIDGNGDIIKSEVKDMVSFSMQYLYSVLNEDEIRLSKSGKEKVVDVVNSFGISEEDKFALSGLLSKIGYNINKVMMVYDNGVPKTWDDLND